MDFVAELVIVWGAIVVIPLLIGGFTAWSLMEAVRAISVGQDYWWIAMALVMAVIFSLARPDITKCNHSSARAFYYCLMGSPVLVIVLRLGGLLF